MFTVVVLISSFLSISGPDEKTARAAASWTLATTVDPVFLYEPAAGVQPLVLSLCDQDNVPVDTTTVADLTWSYGTPPSFVEAAPPRQISSGYWLFTGTTVAATDVHISAKGTVGGVPLASNIVIITPRTLGAFNPQLLLMTHDSLLQNKDGYVLYGKHVFDRLPCTIGNSFEILSALYSPKGVEKDYPGYTVKRVANDAGGNLTKGAAVAWPVENANILAGSAIGNKYLVNGAGAISVQLNADVWTFADPACPTFDEGRNAIPNVYVKTFTCGEVTLPTTVNKITFSRNDKGTNDVRIDFQGPCDRVWEWAVDITALKADGSVDARFGTAGHVWYNGIPASQSPSATGIADLPGQGLAGSDGALPTSRMMATSNCSNLILQGVDFAGVWGDTLVFWMYRNQEPKGTAGWTHPAAFAGTLGVTAPFLETTIAGTTLVKTLVAGVPQNITMTGVAFSVGTPSWTTTLNGSTEGVPQYKPIAGSSGAWTIDMSPALPRAGKLTLTGVAVDAAIGKRETATVSWDVVMPEFTVTLKLSDGTTIANDHLLTEGVLETVLVAATNPLTKKPVKIWWEKLSAHASVGFGGAPTCVIWAVSKPSGGVLLAGIANPYFSEGTAKLSVYALLGGAKVLVDTFTLTPPVLTVTPSEIPYTIPASATRLDFHALDAHTHPSVGCSIRITGTIPTGSQYSFVAGSARTDSIGTAAWAFVPPYAGPYAACVEPADVEWPSDGSECVFSSWKTRRETAGATITAKYNAPPIDTEKPTIVIAEGIDGATVNTSTFTIIGKVTDNVGVTQLFVGFDKVAALADGSFTTSLTLVEGDNPITIVAYDAAGNKGTASVTVTYQPPIVPPAPKATVIVLAIGSATATVNGASTGLDVAPEILGGRTFVPIRFIAETFGADVNWLAATQGITITLGDHTIGLQVGNPSSVVDGTISPMEAAPYIKNSRTMVPLRLIAQAFGSRVDWDPVGRTVTITYTAP